MDLEKIFDTLQKCINDLEILSDEIEDNNLKGKMKWVFENLNSVNSKLYRETHNNNEKVNLFDTIWDYISCYDEEYAQEQGIDKLDDEDIYNIISNILDSADIQYIIREEIENYAGYKNN